MIVEDYLVSKIQPKLVEMGLSDKIGLFVISTEGPEIIEDPSILSNPLELQMQCLNKVALYYVVGEDEPYDYDMLHDVFMAIQNDIFIGPNISKLYIKLYRAKDEDRLTFMKLMRENPLTENYIREDEFLLRNEISGNDSEAFRYLNHVATKEEFMFLSGFPFRESYPQDVMFEVMKHKNEFMRYVE